MNKEEKIDYVIKLLIEIGLLETKIIYIKRELDQKNEQDIDLFIIKLENYYTNQNIIDKEFIRKLEKINNQIDESIESTIEKANISIFNF